MIFFYCYNEIQLQILFIMKHDKLLNGVVDMVVVGMGIRSRVTEDLLLQL